MSKEVEHDNALHIRQDDLKHLISTTEFSMAKNDARYYLNGMLFEIEDEKITTVATDGHRLAKSTLQLDKPVGEKRQSIMPKKTIAVLQQILGRNEDTLQISISTSDFFINLGGISISAKAINGQFPDYRRVIPASFEQEIMLDRNKTLVSLRRAAAITDGKPGGATLDFSPGLLRLFVKNTEEEEARVDQEIEYQGEPFKIGFNALYLSEVLQHLYSDTFLLQIRDSSSGVRIVGGDSVPEEYVVMPLRL